MAERISPEQFQAADGVGDWHALPTGASARFATGTFARGVQLVDAIAVLAEQANHHPDVDLRYPSVTVTLFTHDIDALSDLDLELAQKVSAAARRLGIPAA